MIWFWSSLISVTLVYIMVMVALFRKREYKSEDFLEWTSYYKWKIGLGYLVCIGILVLAMIKPLWHTMTCQFDGWAANTETSYSWYKGQCLYKSKTGAWLPLGISRDQPEGGSSEF